MLIIFPFMRLQKPTFITDGDDGDDDGDEADSKGEGITNKLCN